MRYYRFIFVIGLWTIVVPFLGVPLTVKKILLVVPGAVLLLIGILMSQEHRREEEENSGISYAEKEPEMESFEAEVTPEEKLKLHQSINLEEDTDENQIEEE